MRFPNAHKGVSKLFLAEILQLIGSVVGIVAGVLMLAAVQANPEGLVEGLMVTAGISAIVLLVAGVVAIIAFILNLVGLVQAKKDDDGFKTALIFALIAIALSIASSCLQTVNPSVAGWMTFAVTIFELAVFEYVVVGIMSLAQQLGDQKMLAYGSKVRLVITILYFVLLVIRLVGGLNEAVTGVMTTIASIVEIVMYIAYLIYLAKAKKMLSQ